MFKLRYVFAVLLASQAAQATTALAFDTNVYCKKVSDAVGGSYVIENGCRDNEGKALTTLRGRRVDTRIAAYCQKVGEAVGGSYVITLGCIDKEEKARAAQK